MSDNIFNVLNSEEELKFLPLKGSIRLKLSDNYSFYAPEEHISVYRVDNKEGLNSYIKSYSDLFASNEFRKEEISVESKDGALFISHKDSFQDNSKYILYIDAGILNVKNTIRVNGEDSNLVNSDKTDKNISIVALSGILSESSKMFAAKVSVDGKLVDNSKLITVPSDISVYDTKISFLDGFTPSIGAEILISTEAETVLESDYKIEFSTGTASQIENVKPVYTSTRIGENDIKKFFDGFDNSKTSSSGSLTDVDDYKTNVNYTVEVRQPSKIFVTFDKQISKEDFDLDLTEVEISEAFGNYHLQMMGLYEDSKYILEFSIIRGSKVLQIEVIKNISEDDDPIIKRWKE